MEPQSEVTAEVIPEPRDYYRPLDWTSGNLLRWTLVVFAALLVLDAWRHWSSPDSEIKIGLIAFLVLAFLYPWIRVRYEFRKFPAFRKPRRFSFDAEGIHFQSEDARGDYNWSVFSKVVETPRVFLFMQTNRSGTTVPKRFFSQPNDIPMLRKLLRENFKGKLMLRAD